MRLSVAMAVACLSISILSAAEPAQAAARQATNIPAQALGTALQALAKQRAFQIVYLSDAVDTMKTQGASGALTPDEALKQLLSGTGLTYRYLDEATVTVYPADAPQAMNGSAGTQGRVAAVGLGAIRWAESESSNSEKKSLWQRLRLAQSDSPQSTEPSEKSNSSSHPSDSSSLNVRLEEVIVTAQKRGEERLLEVPIPVTAISGESLVNTGQTSLREFYDRVPGLNLTSTNIATVISIRGISTALLNNGTTRFMIDDIPYGSSGVSGDDVPEIDPTELARVEVLRGPQGTLYGASSMGGLLSYVTVDPTMDRIKGQLRGGFSGIENGDGPGYNASGAINLPLSDTFAVRASGFTEHTPGYIDDPVHGQEGINSVKTWGGRVGALWRPSDSFSAKLGALLRDSRSDAPPVVNLLPGFTTPQGLTQNRVPNSGENRKRLSIFSAHLGADLGNVNLNSISAYIDNRPVAVIGNRPAVGTPGIADSDRTYRKFAQELRMTTALGQKTDWLLGVLYTNEDFVGFGNFFSTDSNTGARTTLLLRNYSPAEYKNYAAFTNLTYRLTDRFDLQVGGRLSRSESASPFSELSGALFGGAVIRSPGLDSRDTAFTYLLTPKFKLSPDLMVYARLASGYRPGGPNANGAQPGIPDSFEPDKTLNYEIGIKGDFLENVLTIDASAYYIDWKDLQLSPLWGPEVSPGVRFSYTGNAGEAKSQGLEFAIQLRPRERLTLSASGAWSHAVLTQDFPTGGSFSLIGKEGDRLPFNPRFSGNISIDQEIPLGPATGSLGISGSYMGERKSFYHLTVEAALCGACEQDSLPSYFSTDLYARVRWSSWEGNLYVNNAFDERGIIVQGIGGFSPSPFWIYTQPRTVGLSFTKRFGE